ncbi:hypothetical protein GCM10010407_06040 [Rarobacter incanus]
MCALVGTVSITPAEAVRVDLARGAAATASSGNAADNVTDVDQSLAWSSKQRLPQWVQVDLGKARKISDIELRLPTAWPARKQTLTILGSRDGKKFSVLAAKKRYTFTPKRKNAVAIDVKDLKVRYVRVLVTANSRASVAQLSSVKVFRRKGADGAIKFKKTINVGTGGVVKARASSAARSAKLALDGDLGTSWVAKSGAKRATLTAAFKARQSVRGIIVKLDPRSGAKKTKMRFAVEVRSPKGTWRRVTKVRTYEFRLTRGNQAAIKINAGITGVRLVFPKISRKYPARVAELQVWARGAQPEVPKMAQQGSSSTSAEANSGAGKDKGRAPRLRWWRDRHRNGPWYGSRY